jgi:hypothetical protein
MKIHRKSFFYHFHSGYDGKSTTISKLNIIFFITIFILMNNNVVKAKQQSFNTKVHIKNLNTNDNQNNDHTSSSSSFIHSFTTTRLPDSIRVEQSTEKVKLKLPNGQILMGNRKTIYFDASHYRASCIQELDTNFPGFKDSEMWNAPGEISEDCLYFNIWVPVTQEQDNILYKKETLRNLDSPRDIKYNPFKSLSHELKTSLIWFYGGSYNSGSANLAVYNGTLLSAFENLIVITPNYRVGPFGFLYLNSSAAPGNAGLADKILAIEWYKENYLDFFGGFTQNVCLFGESAGAMSLHHLLLTKKNHIFNRVILQSSSSYSDLSHRTPSDSYQVWLNYAEKVGCLTITQDYVNVDVQPPLKMKFKRRQALKSKLRLNTEEVKQAFFVSYH